NNKKLEVIKRYETHGIKSTLQRFFSHVTKQKTSENQVYQWKQNRAIIEESCKTARTAVKKKNRSSGVATSLPTAAELELVEWVNELRNEGIIDRPTIGQRCELPSLLEDDEGEDMFALLQATGLLDTEVGIIDPDNDLDP
ncbi:hypothetical protein PR002_g21559, partial [Phytophthora rubi]